MSRLLINENPLQVLPGLACAIGLNEAIVLQQIHYWMKNSQHFHDGRLWVYNSIPEWQAQFPFWSDSTVKRALSSLEKQGLVFTGNYNDDSWDKTKWYSIDYQKVEALDGGNKPVTDRSGQNDPIDDTNMTPASGQNDLTPQVKMTPSLTENTTETTTEIISESGTPASQPEKIDYQKILDVYHDTLPEMAQVKILTDARKKTIRNFWKKFKFNPERWEAYLRYIASNCRWMLEDRPNGRGGFWKRKNIDYLITERCYVAVKEERANDQ